MSSMRESRSARASNTGLRIPRSTDQTLHHFGATIRGARRAMPSTMAWPAARPPRWPRQCRAAEALDRRSDGLLERVAVGHVDAQPERTIRADPLCRGLRLAFVEVQQSNRRAALVQQPGGLEADPARGTG